MGLRHSRGDNNRGKKPLGREKLRVNAIEGLDWLPLCRGRALRPKYGGHDQSPKAIG
jgi:hypothetical protein